MSRGFAIEELRRALDNMLRVGKISEVDYDAARARVRVGDLETGWLPFMAQRAGGDRSWWAPEIGEQVMILAPSGDTELAVIAPGALYHDARPAPANAATVHRSVYDDGAVIEYDREAHQLRVELPPGGSITVIATGGVEIFGDLVVSGDVHAGGADGVSLLTHKHTNVSPGASLTGEPDN